MDERREYERRKYLKLQPSGYGGTNHGARALPEVLAMRPRFVVDFGCGRNKFIRELRRNGIAGMGVDFVNNDADIIAPMHAVPLESGASDLITSFDSLEHLLPEDVDLVLNEMQRIATSWARFIFSICTRPSRITVDGCNLHPTVQPLPWWLERIARVGCVEAPKGYIRGVFLPKASKEKPLPSALNVRRFFTTRESVLNTVPRSLSKDQNDARALWSRSEIDNALLNTPKMGYFPYFYNADGMPVWLNSAYRGQSAFLLAGGPSARALPFEKLKRCWTMTLNNAHTTFRGNAACMVDDASRFSMSLWFDPTVMKFAAMSQFGKMLWDNRLVGGALRGPCGEGAAGTPCGEGAAATGGRLVGGRQVAI